MQVSFVGSNKDKFISTEETKWSLTSETGTTVSKISLSYGTNGTAYISHIQLEEGNKATEFEPYYVTSDVKVTQERDHTLKAIWKENT